MRTYRHQVRDGERVVWVEGDGSFRRLADNSPSGQATARIARAVLQDTTGYPVQDGMVARFAAWLDGLGYRWDLTVDDVRLWLEFGGRMPAPPGDA